AQTAPNSPDLLFFRPLTFLDGVELVRVERVKNRIVDGFAQHVRIQRLDLPTISRSSTGYVFFKPRAAFLRGIRGQVEFFNLVPGDCWSGRDAINPRIVAKAADGIISQV